MGWKGKNAERGAYIGALQFEFDFSRTESANILEELVLLAIVPQSLATGCFEGLVVVSGGLFESGSEIALSHLFDLYSSSGLFSGSEFLASISFGDDGGIIGAVNLLVGFGRFHVEVAWMVDGGLVLGSCRTRDVAIDVFADFDGELMGNMLRILVL